MTINASRAARLLVMGWDGMRPDLVSSELTPNLAALAGSGVVFERSHAVVPTVTRCNAGTLASGAPPAAHGLPANMLWAPLVDATNLISFGEGDSFEQLRSAYGVFQAPTIADVVAEAGGRTVVVSSGTRGCAQMLNPRRRERGELIVHPTLSTETELAPIVERLGPLPKADVPDVARNEWLARAIAEIIIPQQRPDVLLFWHDDPDKSQHRFGFGHPLSLEAIRSADRHLGIILAGLDAAGLREETIVAIVSDHGYVQIGEQVDLAAELAASDLGDEVIVAPNGCSALLFQQRQDPRVLEKVVRRLQALPGVGTIFSGSRGGPVLDGTFSLPLIGNDGPLAADLLVTFACNDGLNEHQHRGMSAAHRPSSKGSHGGASAWEVRNTMILAGPGIRSGHTSELPSGSLDLAPTVLTALGLAPTASMIGRVLSEALVDGATFGSAAPTVAGEPIVERIATARGSAALRWSEAGGCRYLDAAWVDRADG